MKSSFLSFLSKEKKMHFLVDYCLLIRPVQGQEIFTIIISSSSLLSITCSAKLDASVVEDRFCGWKFFFSKTSAHMVKSNFTATTKAPNSYDLIHWWWLYAHRYYISGFYLVWRRRILYWKQRRNWLVAVNLPEKTARPLSPIWTESSGLPSIRSVPSIVPQGLAMQDVLRGIRKRSSNPKQRQKKTWKLYVFKEENFLNVNTKITCFVFGRQSCNFGRLPSV